MKILLSVAFLCFSAAETSPRQDPVLPPAIALAEWREAHALARRAADLARTEAGQAYKAAAKLRVAGGILDPDPECEEAETRALSGSGPLLVSYLAAKRNYLRAKHAAEAAEMTLLRMGAGCGPKL